MNEAEHINYVQNIAWEGHAYYITGRDKQIMVFTLVMYFDFWVSPKTAVVCRSIGHLSQLAHSNVRNFDYKS